MNYIKTLISALLLFGISIPTYSESNNVQETEVTNSLEKEKSEIDQPSSSYIGSGIRTLLVYGLLFDKDIFVIALSIYLIKEGINFISYVQELEKKIEKEKAELKESIRIKNLALATEV